MEENKKHIVLVTAWYPPRKGVAVNRMLAFVKYLDHRKYIFSVVSLREGNEPGRERADDVNIHRLENTSFLHGFRERAGEPRILHNLKVLANVTLNTIKPFEYLGWKKKVVSCLSEINEASSVSAVISSYSPVEAHLAALEFCSRNPHVKWIADMRDEMSVNPHLSKGMKSRLRLLEKKIDRRADAVTAVSLPILNDFKKLMPSVRYFEEIRNGFDHGLERKDNFNREFTISYSGTFYGKRKPDTFFSALKKIIIEKNIRLKIQFIGTHRNFSVPEEAESFCEFIPEVPALNAVEMMGNADANLLILPPVEGKGVFTGKIFDYLSVMKPIIAVVDTSDVAAGLINECRAGFVADFNNIGEIKKAIESAYQVWFEKRTLPYDATKVRLLHRRYQVEKLGQLIDKLLLT